MRRIILITGGARSGKSTYAEKLALSLSPNPVYLATARIWDEEFRKRVIHHQERRGPEWTNIEEANNMIDDRITFYNRERIQTKTGVAPLTLRHSV